MNMNDMREATRLTRQGRIGEATSLLRRLLTGAAAPPPASEPAAGERPTIDLVPPKPGETTWTVAPDAPAGQAEAARRTPQPDAGEPAGLGIARGVLNSLAGRLKAKRRPATEPVPSGARFEERVFANAAGQRAYRLYVPSRYDDQPMPLVIMLHGCTQNPEDFAAGTRMNELAEEFGVIVAYPEQPQSANAQRCWNWFSRADQVREAGEPSLIAGITRTVMADLAVDPTRVFAAGMSAGGAEAAILGETYPDLFRAVGIHSGLAYGSAHDVPSAFAAMKSGGSSRAGSAGGRAVGRVRAIVFHGDRDQTVAPVNGDQVMDQFAGAGPDAGTRGAAPGGLGFTRVERAGCEYWTVHGAGHAWSGGSRAGSYTDPRGPDASREMLRFFLAA